MSEPQLFECRNKSCTLGTREQPGHFTGGITAEQLHVLTGRPVESIEKDEAGEGVCPNCGTRGKAVKS